jgi:thiol-disulfide isomerase/thioredoxin
MNPADYFSHALSYQEFLDQHGNDGDRRKWQQVYEQTTLKQEQTALLNGFTRELNILVFAGAWCGDCVVQCPIFQRFADTTSTLNIRFVDRDTFPELKQELTICGGARVPQLLFFNEDMQYVGHYGDRTISKYRAMAETITGAACSIGMVTPGDSVHEQVIQDWLNEFERVQLICRTSPRLREKHND